MDQTTVSTDTANTETQTAPQPDINQLLGNSLWGVPTAQVDPPVPAQTVPAADTTIATTITDTPPPSPQEDIFDEEDYVKNIFGVGLNEAKEKWNKWKEYDINPPAPIAQEVQWANDDSKRIHDLIREGKSEDVWKYLDQQRQLQRLENLNISNAQEASEIIKADLRFKHSNLSSDQIDRLFERQYGMPKQPVQGVMDDDDYAIELNTWKQQVQQREQDMIIDATIAKPEFAKYKSNIVLPDIQRNEPQTQTVDQEALVKQQEAFRNNYLTAVGSNYQNFKGYSVTAKDGDVELPISYVVSPEEQAASKQLLETFDSNQFLDSRWFDGKGNPNVTQIQEDLYLLMNRDKIFQKIANEASAQRYLHQVKKQNNINLNGITNTPPPVPAGSDARTDSQKLGDALWGKR